LALQKSLIYQARKSGFRIDIPACMMLDFSGGRYKIGIVNSKVKDEKIIH
jgi:hypothetical protein